MALKQYNIMLPNRVVEAIRAAARISGENHRDIVQRALHAELRQMQERCPVPGYSVAMTALGHGDI